MPEHGSVPARRGRGRISCIWTAWCGTCGRWDNLHGTPAQCAKDAGWRNTKAHGWVCPDCQVKRD